MVSDQRLVSRRKTMPHDAHGRDAIVETAGRLFNQKGYQGVSIRDIARACHLTNAALYYHFKNKPELFLAVLRRDHEKVMASISEAVAMEGELSDRLKRLVRSYANVLCGQRRSFQTLRRDLSNIGHDRAGRLFGEIHSDFMRPLEQVIELGQASGQIVAIDARLLARMLHGMIIALTFEGKFGRQNRLTGDEADAVVDVFLNGVGRRGKRKA
jgi:AcrR family transcriptional regulator